MISLKIVFYEINAANTVRSWVFVIFYCSELKLCHFNLLVRYDNLIKSMEQPFDKGIIIPGTIFINGKTQMPILLVNSVPVIGINHDSLCVKIVDPYFAQILSFINCIPWSAWSCCMLNVFCPKPHLIKFCGLISVLEKVSIKNGEVDCRW